MDNYLHVRQAIYSKLANFKKKYNFSQAKIAKIVSEDSGVKFHPKDVNALNNLQNQTKWRGQARRSKLELFLTTIRKIEKNQFTLYDKSYLEKQENINSLVENAIHAEFKAYQTLPDLKKAKEIIAPYFIPNSSALKNIHGILERNQKRNWSLIDPLNPSTVKLISSEIMEINDQQVVVTTKEYWLLIWVNNLSKARDYIYEKEAEQKYILIKNENTEAFQVAVNSYEPIEKKVLPKVFNEGVFDDVLKKNSAEIAKTVRQVIAIGGFDAALQILQQYSSQTKLQDILRNVSGIQATLSEQTRLLNTGKITQEDYFKKKEELVDLVFILIEKFEEVE